MATLSRHWPAGFSGCARLAAIEMASMPRQARLPLSPQLEMSWLMIASHFASYEPTAAG